MTVLALTQQATISLAPAEYRRHLEQPRRLPEVLADVLERLDGVKGLEWRVQEDTSTNLDLPWQVGYLEEMAFGALLGALAALNFTEHTLVQCADCDAPASCHCAEARA
ncbi:hypothetical protein MF271_05105 [Deinococcus sp. KNUC1210]|uniref:hypothetical protein n=1 Tax=Deinococcus sp. KNUC1210 TaxID=2917691 RepID=UPI001EF10E0E|nr:hypothetical protein [Deinococcus sp. KNUC1210]ULH16014.1 hypothetical protein MF271_05105 [Deinococcus sp. KNUC1210]